jgi:hypothetical protein
MFTTQNAFDWLDSTSSAEETANAQLDRHTVRSRNTSFTASSTSALSGRWTPQRPLLQATDDTRGAADHKEMMPLTNLCNRLVVTSTRPTPNSQA